MLFSSVDNRTISRNDSLRKLYRPQLRYSLHDQRITRKRKVRHVHSIGRLISHEKLTIEHPENLSVLVPNHNTFEFSRPDSTFVVNVQAIRYSLPDETELSSRRRHRILVEMICVDEGS